MVNYTFNESEIKTIWKHNKNKRYEIKSFINKGGYVKYVVFYDKQTKKQCTGKVVSKFSEGEVYHWPRLHHKNLAQLSDVIYLDERLGIYMTSHFKLSLRQLIHKDDFINDPQCFHKKKVYVQDILSGIDYLHSKNLALMKVSDAGIFIVHELDKAVISDFTCLSMVQNAVRHKRCAPLLSRAPELTMSAPCAKSGQFDPISADIWSVGIMILDIFLCHMTPWGYVDYNSGRAMEVCSIVDRDLLQLANKGTAITRQNVDSFKNFASLFLDINPKNRGSLKSAISKPFIRSALHDIEKCTIHFKKNNKHLLSSDTCEDKKTEDVLPLCDIFEKESIPETKSEPISRQIQIHLPQEVPLKSKVQHITHSPKIETKNSEYNINLYPNKVTFQKYKTEQDADFNSIPKLEIHSNNKNNVHIKITPDSYLSLKETAPAENIADFNQICRNKTKAGSITIADTNKKAAMANFNDEHMLQKFENADHITETNSLYQKQDIFKTESEEHFKHLPKRKFDELSDVLMHEKKSTIIGNGVNSSTLKIASQLPSSAPVLRHLIFSTNTLNSTIDDNSKKCGFNTMLPDKDYLKNEVISNDEMFTVKNVNDSWNMPTQTNKNKKDEKKINVNSMSVIRQSDNYIPHKTDFSNASEPSISPKVQKKINPLKVELKFVQTSSSNALSPLNNKHEEFIEESNAPQSLPEWFDYDKNMHEYDRAIALEDLSNDINDDHNINDKGQQTVYNRPLQVIKHEPGCPHYRELQTHQKKYRPFNMKQLAFNSGNISSKQKCDVTKFLLETEETNPSRYAQSKCKKSKKKNKKIHAEGNDDEEEDGTNKPRKTRKHFCFF